MYNIHWHVVKLQTAADSQSTNPEICPSYFYRYFILMYTCGLTVVIKRICYVMLDNVFNTHKNAK